MNVTAETVQVGKHYHELRDAPKVKPFEVLSKDEPRACPGNIHLRTTRGDWCVGLLQEFRAAE